MLGSWTYVMGFQNMRLGGGVCGNAGLMSISALKAGGVLDEQGRRGGQGVGYTATTAGMP